MDTPLQTITARKSPFSVDWLVLLLFLALVVFGCSACVVQAMNLATPISSVGQVDQASSWYGLSAHSDWVFAFS